MTSERLGYLLGMVAGGSMAALAVLDLTWVLPMMACFVIAGYTFAALMEAT